MGPELERPLRRYGGILLPQRARSSIPRIGEQLAARFLLRLVECLEIGLGHVDLAADFKHLRDIGTGQFLRDIGDIGDVRRDIFTDLAVTTRCGAHQLASLIAQRARKTVDLVFRRDGYRVTLVQREKTPHARHPLIHFLR